MPVGMKRFDVPKVRGLCMYSHTMAGKSLRLHFSVSFNSTLLLWIWQGGTLSSAQSRGLVQGVLPRARSGSFQTHFDLLPGHQP